MGASIQPLSTERQSSGSAVPGTEADVGTTCSMAASTPPHANTLSYQHPISGEKRTPIKIEATKRYCERHRTFHVCKFTRLRADEEKRRATLEEGAEADVPYEESSRVRT